MEQRVKHTACPKCRELGKDNHGDNLAIYPDGNQYCFSCGYVSNPSPLSKLKNSLQPVHTGTIRTYYLPVDVS